MISLNPSLCLAWFISLNIISATPAISPRIRQFLSQKPQAPLYEKIARENLKAVVSEQEPSVAATINALINDEKEFYQLLEEALERAIHAPRETKRAAIFKLFAEYERTSGWRPQSDVLDETTWQDLELLCGPKTAPFLCIAEKIGRHASTEAGRAILYRKIIQPEATVDKIRAQQDTIKLLVARESFFDALHQKLQELSNTEDAVLSFFGDDLFYAIALQNMVKILGQDQIPAIKTLSNALNKNEFLLEFMNRVQFMAWRYSEFTLLVGVPALCAYGFCKIFDIQSPQVFKEYGLDVGHLSKQLVIGSCIYFVRWLFPSSHMDGLAHLSDSLAGFQRLYHASTNFKTDMIFDNGLQTKLIAVATFLNNMQDVVALASTDPDLEQLPMIQTLKRAFGALFKDSDMAHLLKLLRTNTFKGKASFFSFKGRIFAAYKLMHELKHKLTPVIAAVGELDAQMAIARLYKEFQAKRVTYCFPTLITDEKTPAISMTDFWDPVIDESVVVPNTLRLGDRYNHCRNIVVSGPNAGGKTTTVIGAFPKALILAQALGISPARALAFTPFRKIITYRNIVDDIAQGNSKFTAGVKRALEILDVAQKTRDGFTLTAIDEALDGAMHNESQAAAYALFEALGKCPTNICLTTTHLSLVCDLEERAGTFVNYKVSVTFDAQGKICYPYKLERGRAHQNIVFKVLNEKGFSDQFLGRSTELLRSLPA